jgi:hypothetical protein
MFTLRENMLLCEKWTRSFELESVLAHTFYDPKRNRCLILPKPMPTCRTSPQRIHPHITQSPTQPHHHHSTQQTGLIMPDLTGKFAALSAANYSAKWGPIGRSNRVIRFVTIIHYA